MNLDTPHEPSFKGKKHFLEVSNKSFKRWDNDPESSVLPETEQKRIYANFKSAIEFQGSGVKGDL